MTGPGQYTTRRLILDGIEERKGFTIRELRRVSGYAVDDGPMEFVVATLWDGTRLTWTMQELLRGDIA